MPPLTTEEQIARWLASFPRRIWEQQKSGKWASREPTRADFIARREAAKRLAGA